MTRTVREPERATPVVGEYDVAVIGAGVAGVAAALAAARTGARVCLVEKEIVPGGLATLGLVAIYLPLCDGRGVQLVGGIGEELLVAAAADGPGTIPACWRPGGDPAGRRAARYRVEFNPASFAVAMERLLVEAGVSLLYDTRFCGVVVRGDAIEAAVFENRDGRVALPAGVFVDATGDADVCMRAGEETVSLDSNRLACWYYSQGADGVRLRQCGDNLYRPVPAGSRTYAADRAADVTAMAVDGRARIARDVLERRSADPGLRPLLIPAVPEFRMGRRLKGRAELVEADERRVFPDAVGMTGDWRKAGPVFFIPFGILHGRTANLLAAGRCVSAADGAWDVLRAIPACVATGQAAGTAAALAAAAGRAVGDLPIGTLQERLRSAGVIIDPALAGPRS